MSMDKEKLIEEAAMAITGTRPHPGGGSQIIFEEAEDFARAALAVFEKAHTPTGDERELAQVIKDFWWECEAGEKPTKHLNGEPTAGDVALAASILAAGFRRSEVPEPQVIERHDLVMPIYEGSEPQGEPSDAQVIAARKAYIQDALTGSGEVSSDFDEFFRTALRAAFAVTEAGASDA